MPQVKSARALQNHVVDPSIKKRIDAVHVVEKKVLKSKQSALRFLVDAGICTRAGRLTSKYK